MGIATVFQAGKRLTAAQLNLRPYFHGYQIATQNLADNAQVPITLDGEFVDTINGHDPATLNTRYEPSVPGWYRCFGQISFAGNITGDRIGRFRKNGNNIDEAPYGAFGAPKTTSSAGTALAFGTIFCNGGGDYIELVGQQSSGGTLATFAASPFSRSYVIIEWVAP